MNRPAESPCPPALARLLCLLAYDAPPAPDEVAAWPSDQWRETVEAAARQGLSPALYRRVVDAGLPAPQDTVARLRQHYLRTAADNTRRFAALEEALLALEAAGVGVILLKGAHLAPLVYGNLALRPMVDLDLLVRDEDAERALGALAGLGYSPVAGEAWMGDRYGHHGLRHGDGHLLELHRRAGAMAVGARMDQAGLWQRAQPASLGRAKALVLDPTDLLLHLCSHAASQHLLQLGLLPVYDIGQALAHAGDRLDAHALVRRAEEWRVARAVYLMLALARELLHVPVEAALLGSLAPHDAREYLALAMRTILSDRTQGAAPSSNLVALWGEPRWHGRLHLLLRVLVPDAQRMRALYGVGADRPIRPWLYLRRWADLATRRGASVAQFLGQPADGVDWQALVRWLAQG